MKTLLVAGALLVSCGAAAAQNGDTIEPDRPDVTNGTRTVAPGTVQIETGVEYARTRAAASEDERRWGFQLTLRTGLTERLEARLDGEPLVRLRGEQNATGLGAVTLSVKYRFLDAGEGSTLPALGVQPFVTLPTAQEPIGSERADFGLIALASFDLPWRLSLDVNAGVAAIGQSRPNGFLVQGRASASLSRELTKSLSVFGEVFYASADERDGRDMVGADAGVMWKVGRDVALDAAVATSLAGALPDYALRAGVSVRFGR